MTFGWRKSARLLAALSMLLSALAVRAGRADDRAETVFVLPESSLVERASAVEPIYVPDIAPGMSQLDLRSPERVSPVDANVYLDALPVVDGYDNYDFYDGQWEWQVLPAGLIYRSYMAGVKEPRMAGVPFYESNVGWQLDATLGGRVGILRYGTYDPLHPEGFEIDVEGAAFPRLSLEDNWDLEYTDFRIGVPFTYGVGPWQIKFAYYHLSSHLGDERAIRVPGTLPARINYSRDVLVLGLSYYITPAMRLYGEAGWAFYDDGGAEPWEFQFGLDWSRPGPTDICGTPFLALNGHLRQEVDFGGNFVAQTGWLWRGETGSTFRAGVQYYNGKSNQYEIFDDFEEQIGFGLWYDY